jgi:hypothetical protein
MSVSSPTESDAPHDHSTENCAACNREAVARKQEAFRKISRPRRRRPKTAYGEAMTFIALAVSHVERAGPVEENIDALRPLFKYYAKNTGLRGSDRDKIWRIVHAAMLEAKAERVAKLKQEAARLKHDAEIVRLADAIRKV